MADFVSRTQRRNPCHSRIALACVARCFPTKNVPVRNGVGKVNVCKTEAWAAPKMSQSSLNCELTFLALCPSHLVDSESREEVSVTRYVYIDCEVYVKLA